MNFSPGSTYLNKMLVAKIILMIVQATTGRRSAGAGSGDPVVDG
ncbi:hypothetical protein FHU40_005512 [Nocardioides soli]|uniref:Uncharacterized protein n=1 Tax=Nocardioides soli TaxID=1036020 RepID=A0A7W4W1D7_9ACTN|nr:hypothetical protein [Nocardioides soli]